MPDYEWMHEVYGDCEEDVSPDLPTPKSKIVCMTSMVDANLMHNKITGKYATGILHLIYQTPVDWFLESKVLWKQPPMVLNLWKLALQQNKSLIFTTH